MRKKIRSSILSGLFLVALSFLYFPASAFAGHGGSHGTWGGGGGSNGGSHGTWGGGGGSNGGGGSYSVPEPSSIVLMGSGLIGLGAWGIRKFRNRK